MITLEKAINLILENTPRLGTHKLPIIAAVGFVIATDIISPIDIPPFTNATMDGYALSYESVKGLPMTIPVIGEIPAGKSFDIEVPSGYAVKIMTGAPLPKGTDTVVELENVEILDVGKVIIKKIDERGTNVRYLGEDFKKNSLVIFSGTKLKEAQIGILASLGISEVEVYRLPKVSIISTGEELVEINEDLPFGKIRNSNSYSLAAAVLLAGGIPSILGIAHDNQDDIESKIKEALDSDIIITTGGVSVGDYDIVNKTLEKMGFEQIFNKVSIKPCKNVLFGLINKKLFFGLPGNPGASLVGFEQFIRPVIRKMSGHHKLFRPEVEVTLDFDIDYNDDRLHLVGVKADMDKTGTYHVSLLKKQGVYNLLSMLTNAFLYVDKPIRKGEKTKIQLIDLPEDH